MTDLDAQPAVRAPGRASGSPWRTAFLVSLALLIAVGSFAGGILAERNLFSGDGRGASGAPTDAEVERILESESYYWPDDPTAQATLRTQIDQKTLDAVTASLDDPYTRYLPPVQAGEEASQLSGEYEGIGVWIEAPDGILTVVAPMIGSPAEEAGIKAGDQLLAADGTPLAGMTPEDAGNLVRGPEGTTVTLSIGREAEPAPFDVAVTRRKIETPVVQYVLDPATKVAVIQVSIFNDRTTEQLDHALTQAQADGAKGLVLDLRDNGGGWVTAAQEMVGRFVPADRGVALYEDDDQSDDNQLIEQPIIGGGPEVYDLPMAVLINGGTASAAEIVAGALKSYGRAAVVGVQSFGKGSVQRIHDFGDGSSLRVTIALWLTPDKQRLEKQGVTPDVVVEQPDDAPPGHGPQLQRAIEVAAAGGARAQPSPGATASPVASPDLATPAG